jgi:very-short-patch-repair endonuclease
LYIWFIAGFSMNTDFFNKSMFYGADSGTMRAASILRRNMTLAEVLLWKRLKMKGINNAKFRRQHPINIFIVDFYCHEIKLVIEIDGEIHDNKEVNEYDQGRTAELEKYGIKVIRFSNNQVICNIDWVTSEILKVISELTPL